MNAGVSVPVRPRTATVAVIARMRFFMRGASCVKDPDESFQILVRYLAPDFSVFAAQCRERSGLLHRTGPLKLPGCSHCLPLPPVGGRQAVMHFCTTQVIGSLRVKRIEHSSGSPGCIGDLGRKYRRVEPVRRGHPCPPGQRLRSIRVLGS